MVFLGDSLDVPDFQVCYPRPVEIEGLLSAATGTNYLDMPLKVSAFVDGAAKSAECVVRASYKAVKRIATKGVEKELKNMFPILETGAQGVVFWDGTGWRKQNWALPPPRAGETNTCIRL
jgi:hypothetical protein